MTAKMQSNFSTSETLKTCGSWLRKAYAELLAVKRIVRLYPKSTLLWPTFVLSLILTVGVWGVTLLADTEEGRARDRAAILALDAAVWVQQLLDNAIAPVMLTAAMVTFSPRYPDVKSLFEGLAPVMLSQAPAGSVRVIQLVPHGVISAVYPLEGNEGAVGLDLFASATNRDGAIQTAKDRTLTLVGPMKFVQGGYGVIVRQPIFVSNVSSEGDFAIPRPLNPACGLPCQYDPVTRTHMWGFASALVNLDALTRANRSKLSTLESLGYQFELLAPRAAGAVAANEMQRVVSSKRLPRDPVEVTIELPNTKWLIRVAPASGWSTNWYGGLLAGVIVLSLATAVLLFAALVSWRRHQVLLEALLPKKILRDLRHQDSGSPLYVCPKIRQSDTPADLLLNMMGDLLEGNPPELRDVVFIRTALLRNLDLYTPLDVRSQIKAADLDSEVAQALMQQLVGGRRNSFIGLDGRQLTGRPDCGATAGPADGNPYTATSTLSYDIDTLSGALAFVLSPEALSRETPAAAAATAAAAAPVGKTSLYVMGSAADASTIVGGGGGGGVMAASSPYNMHSCPLLVRTPPPPSYLTRTSLAELVTAPAAAGGCSGEFSEEYDDGAAGTATSPLALAPSLPLATSSAQIAVIRPLPAQSGSTFGVLLRAHGGQQNDAVRMAVPVPSLQLPSPVQQHGSLPWSLSSQRNRLSTSAAGGGGGGSSGGVCINVCAACGSPVTAGPPESNSSVSGSSAGKLMAVARKLRGVAGGVGSAAAAVERATPLQGSVSLNGTSIAGGGGGGGGGRPGSRLALSLSPRDERPPPQLQLQPPPRAVKSPSQSPARAVAALITNGGATAATSGGGGGMIAAIAAAAGSVNRTRTADDTDWQSGGEAPQVVGLVAEEVEAVVVGPAATAAEAEAEASAAEGISGGRPAAPLLEEVERVLATADGWQFDAWALREASGGHALSALGFFLIQRQGLLARFQIKPMVLARLLRHIEAGYQDNPYHNATHAADVLQCLHVLVHGAQLHVHYLDPLGLMAAYFAAIIHDYGHPGLTGDFLVASSHPLALRYNDRSPLESHHCAAAFTLMSRHPDLDVTAPLSAGERSSFRKLVIDLVLATDMKQHFSILSHFNTVHRLAAYSQQQQQQQPAGGPPAAAGAVPGAATGSTSSPGPPAAAGGGGGGALRLSASNSRMGSGGAGAPAGAPHGPGGHSTGNGPSAAGSAAVSSPAGSLPSDVMVVVDAGPGTVADSRPAPRPVDETERLLSLQLALKCADIGNLGRELDCYKRWVDVLEEEFFRQGDLERRMGLPISPLCDRAKQGVTKSQTGFFDFVALPLVHAMAAAFSGAQPLLRSFLANYNYWKHGEAAASAAASLDRDKDRDSVTSSPQEKQHQQQPPTTGTGMGPQPSPSAKDLAGRTSWRRSPTHPHPAGQGQGSPLATPSTTSSRQQQRLSLSLAPSPQQQ